MAKSPQYVIETVHPVGRYALGIRWGDGHESIYPFEHLRRLCPCLDCGKTQAVTKVPDENARRLESVRRVEDASVMLYWGDRHESFFLVEELREICGCAACKGEPDYPITGR